MKKILITGANRGIGLELARVFAKNDYEVFAVCRKSSRELEELKNTHIIEGVDVTDKSTFTAIFEKLGNLKLDVFINNAGVLNQDSLSNINEASLREQFEVNSIAPLVMTQALLKYFKEGTKVGILTSRMGSVSDNESGGYYGYRASKAAANAIAKSLSVDLKKEGVSVAILHPGFVQTEMTGGAGEITADISAAGLFKVMENLTLNNSGSFWHSNGDELPF